MDPDALRLKALSAVLSNPTALQLLPDRDLLSNPESLQQFLAVQIPTTGSCTQQQHGSFYDFQPLIFSIS